MTRTWNPTETAAPSPAADGVATMLVCKRCGRECNPWPLERGKRCSPANWALCIAPVEMCRLVEVAS